MTSFQYDSPLVYNSNQAYDPYVPPVTEVTVVVIPHLQAPVRLSADGSFSFLTQDTIEEITQSVEVIMGSTPGERTVVPTFGITDPTFTNPNPGAIESVLTTWEPRAVTNVTVTFSDYDSQASINVAVQPQQRYAANRQN